METWRHGDIETCVHTHNALSCEYICIFLQENPKRVFAFSATGTRIPPAVFLDANYKTLETAADNGGTNYYHLVINNKKRSNAVRGCIAAWDPKLVLTKYFGEGDIITFAKDESPGTHFILKNIQAGKSLLMQGKASTYAIWSRKDEDRKNQIDDLKKNANVDILDKDAAKLAKTLQITLRNSALKPLGKRTAAIPRSDDAGKKQRKGSPCHVPGSQSGEDDEQDLSGMGAAGGEDVMGEAGPAGGGGGGVNAYDTDDDDRIPDVVDEHATQPEDPVLNDAEGGSVLADPSGGFNEENLRVLGEAGDIYAQMLLDKNTLLQRVESRDKTIAERDAMIASVKRTVESLCGRIEDKNRALTQKDKDISEWRNQHAADSAAKDAKIAELEAKVAAEAKQHNATHVAGAMIEQQRDYLQQKLNENAALLQQQSDVIRNNASVLERTAAELESNAAHIADLESRLSNVDQGAPSESVAILQKERDDAVKRQGELQKERDVAVRQFKEEHMKVVVLESRLLKLQDGTSIRETTESLQQARAEIVEIRKYNGMLLKEKDIFTDRLIAAEKDGGERVLAVDRANWDKDRKELATLRLAYHQVVYENGRASAQLQALGHTRHEIHIPSASARNSAPAVRTDESC